jgi:hypothetical protein
MWIWHTFRILPRPSSFVLLYWHSSGVITPEKQLLVSDMRDFSPMAEAWETVRTFVPSSIAVLEGSQPLPDGPPKRNVTAKAAHFLLTAIAGGPMIASNRSADYWKTEKGSRTTIPALVRCHVASGEAVAST